MSVNFHKNQVRMHTQGGNVFLHKRDTSLVNQWVKRYSPGETTQKEREYQGEPPREFDERLDYLKGGESFPKFFSHEYWTIGKEHPSYQQAYNEAWNITVFEQYSEQDAMEKDYQRRKQFLLSAGYSL